METVFSIGYEGKTLEECIRIFKKHNISLIIDVRQNPISRKKGFSKEKLCNALEAEGFKYIHLVELGNPKEIRDEYHQNNSTNFLYDEYGKYLDERPELIDTLYSYVSGNYACLLCFEKHPIECHRGVLTDYLHKYKGMSVKHL